ncbi:sulfatase [Ulvibacterium marinum]|uniref:sulfatase n=1 Tax=Ulvibacterium marinum TaxID=2419782 RepID=UPI0024943393|nr:sulfatase [Ulvibacterium marinum]
MFRFFLILIITFFFSGCVENPPPKKVKPNILFIAVDDLRTELGVYNSIAKSPNLDSLARTGSYFTRHYVQVPTCGASRHALLTGMRPSKPIHLSNKAIEKEISGKPEQVIPETFIHKFKKEGYHTVGIGKISHSADGLVYGYEEPVSNKKELPHSWSELLFDAGQWETGWNAFFAYADGENRQSLKKQVKPYEKGNVGDDGYPDGLTTKLALAKLQELKNKEEPFFMGVGYFKPHLPFNAPKKYWDLYDRDSIPLAPYPKIPEGIHSKSLHESGEFNQYALGEEKAGLSKIVSDAYAKKLRHGYLASISYIDAQIGKLWKELKVLGLDKNTIIVIWGDHGWHLGDQRVWGKHTLFENALKSTLIIKSPYLEHENKKVDHIVETVDIYPTLLELCDLKINHSVDGESFAHTMESIQKQSNGVAYGYFKNGITLRTDSYRLTQYYREEKPTVELYDHTRDPEESRNIAKDNPEIVQELIPILKQGNTGLYDF